MTSEMHRQQCEVRHVLRIRAGSRDAADDYLAAVAKSRGKKAAGALRELCTEQWQKGNRGAKGEWL